MSGTPIILDCDPGHDDAIALLLALASPEVDLIGVTTVAGNQTLEKTTANAIRILEFADRTDVPVVAGANRPLFREPYVARYVHGDTGLDGPDLPPAQGSPLDEHAVDFLGRHAGGATLVAVGPLTNIALMLARYPDVRPERIVLMGGSIGVGNVTPAAEFNIWADPEAAARVFESGLDVTMIGLDVTHEALMTGADADRLRATGRTGNARRRALGVLQPVPLPDVRLRRLADPRRRGARAGLPPGSGRDGAPPCRDRVRLRSDPRPNGRRPLAPHGERAERARRRRHRRPRVHRAPARATQRTGLERSGAAANGSRPVLPGWRAVHARAVTARSAAPLLRRHGRRYWRRRACGEARRRPRSGVTAGW